MGTLLEAIGIVLETYFGFGFPNAYAIGDSLIWLAALSALNTIDRLFNLYLSFLFFVYTQSDGTRWILDGHSSQWSTQFEQSIIPGPESSSSDHESSNCLRARDLFLDMIPDQQVFRNINNLVQLDAHGRKRWAPAWWRRWPAWRNNRGGDDGRHDGVPPAAAAPYLDVHEGIEHHDVRGYRPTI